MQIAIVKDQTITNIGDYRDLFPNNTWPGGTPSSEWLAENDCMIVTLFKSYDNKTQKIVPSEPYIENGQVFAVEVVSLSDDEIATNNINNLEQIKNTIVRSTQNRLDGFAHTRGYDSILSACTYATSTVDKFRNEGMYCVEARDQTWETLYTIMSEVESGSRPIPTNYSDIESLLPELIWPV